MTNPTHHKIGTGERYLVEGPLGEVGSADRGGWSEVYLARDLNERMQGRKVVVKFPKPDVTKDDDFARRFDREIGKLIEAGEVHPNIVPILDAGEFGGRAFCVLKYMEGGSLEARITRKDRGVDGSEVRRSVIQAPAEVAEWLPLVAAALDAVHRQGVIHRDVKPANILFSKAGHPFLSDFGIAKAAAGGGGETPTRQAMSLYTPGYQSPEMARGKKAVFACDRYALAVVVYRALSGALPHWPAREALDEYESPWEALKFLRGSAPAASLAVVAPQISGKIVEVVMRALDPDERQRFHQCTQFADAFTKAVRKQGAKNVRDSVFSGVTPPPPVVPPSAPPAVRPPTPRPTPGRSPAVGRDALPPDDAAMPGGPNWRRRGVFAVLGGIAAVAAIAAVAVAVSSGRGGGGATRPSTPPAPGPVAAGERERPSPAMGDAPAMEAPPGPAAATPPAADPSAPRAAAVRSALAAATTAAAARRWEDVRAQLAVARAAGADDAAIPAALVTGLATYDAPPRLDVVTPAEGAELVESPVEVVVRFASGRPTDRVRVNGAPVLARADVFVAEVALTQPGSVDLAVTVVDVGDDGKGTAVRGRVVRRVRYVPGPWVTFLQSFATPDGGAVDPATGYPRRIRRLRDGATMVLVPAGSFAMGATAGSASLRSDELPRRTVHVSHAYYLDATEVTVGAWRRFAKATGRKDAPPANVADELPMASVTFADAEAFATWAGVRLPTEAQWERAARGGKEGEAFPWGAADDAKQRRVGATGPAPVGIFPANAFGLLDLVGNVAEWCADGYDPDAYRVQRALDPRGSDAWSLRVVRGGGWRAPEAATSARRVGVDPRVADDELGFRCARELP